MNNKEEIRKLWEKIGELGEIQRELLSIIQKQSGLVDNVEKRLRRFEQIVLELDHEHTRY